MKEVVGGKRMHAKSLTGAQKYNFEIRAERIELSTSCVENSGTSGEL